MGPHENELIRIISQYNEAGIEPDVEDIRKEYPYRETSYIFVRLRNLINLGHLEKRGRRYSVPNTKARTFKFSSYALTELGKKHPLVKGLTKVATSGTPENFNTMREYLKDTIPQDLIDLFILLDYFIHTNSRQGYPPIDIEWNEEIDNPKANLELQNLINALSVLNNEN